MSWSTKTLGDLISLQRGYDLPEYERKPGDVPVYGSFGITGYHNVARAVGPGVTIGRSGASFGVVSYSPVDYWPHNATLFVTDFKGNAPRFVSYLLRSLDFKRLNSGSAQPSLNRNYLYPLKIRVPDSGTQLRIAEVLSAYDDLIENNIRRIRILEAIARMIYREWFVNFRFPGHPKVSMMASEDGPIPTGWKVEPLRELTTLISRGISPQYDDEATGLVINQKCIRNGRLSLEPARRQSKKVPEDKLVRLGDVLINSTGVGTLGRVAQVLESVSDCTVDSHVSIVRPRNHSEFLGKALLQLEEEFERLGVGSTGQTELSRERIGSSKIIVPTPDLRERFSRVVAPMNGMIVCCLARNSNLRQTRDLLLPKLISGEVSVEQSEAEAVAQGV